MANKNVMDLIDRKALGIGYANPLAFDKPDYAHGWNSAIELITKAPTVEAAEVAHGEWVACGDGSYVPFMCSACGKTTPFYLGLVAKYCPNCGAMMDGRK